MLKEVGSYDRVVATDTPVFCVILVADFLVFDEELVIID